MKLFPLLSSFLLLIASGLANSNTVELASRFSDKAEKEDGYFSQCLKAYYKEVIAGRGRVALQGVSERFKDKKGAKVYLSNVDSWFLFLTGEDNGDSSDLFASQPPTYYLDFSCDQDLEPMFMKALALHFEALYRYEFPILDTPLFHYQYFEENPNLLLSEIICGLVCAAQSNSIFGVSQLPAEETAKQVVFSKRRTTKCLQNLYSNENARPAFKNVLKFLKENEFPDMEQLSAKTWRDVGDSKKGWDEVLDLPAQHLVPPTRSKYNVISFFARYFDRHLGKDDFKDQKHFEMLKASHPYLRGLYFLQHGIPD